MLRNFQQHFKMYTKMLAYKPSKLDSTNDHPLLSIRLLDWVEPSINIYGR